MLYTLNKEHGGHPSLIHLVEVLVDQSKLHAIMEWIPGGNLASIIVQNGTFAEERVQRLIFSLLQGVQFLHSHHVVHTNLQPENILLASTRQVKIVDFGSAVDLEVYEPFGSRGTNVSFTAPEVLLGKESYDTQADMWSVGCLAYYMLSGSSPFDNDSRRKAIQRIIRAEYSFPSEKFPPNASRTAKQFISNLIHADPSVRLTASEALNHPWLQKAKMEDQQELKSSQHHGLFGRSSHHKQHHSMDANIMGHLNIMPNSTHPQQNGHHSRHQSLSPCPSARNGNKSKSHRRKTSFGSLSKGISKLFSCKDESIKSATVASSSSAASVADTTASEIAVHMGSSRTLNSGDDSWSGGVSIPSLVNSNTWGGSSGNTRKVNNRMSHRRQLTK